MNAPRADQKAVPVLRVVAVIGLAAVVLWYSVEVIAGRIPKDRQIDTTHLTLIVLTLVACALILRPHLFDRVGSFEGPGFKLELLQQLQERQVAQGAKLDDLDMLVPLLFRDAELKHLSNLSRGTTKGYKGGGALRDELRRLRSIGLIESLHDRHVGDLHSDTTFDLADWVRLTHFGRRWADRLKRLEEAAIEAPKAEEAI